MSRLRLLVVLLYVAAVADNVLAADRYWTGTVDNRWSVAGNWRDGVAPAAGDSLHFEDFFAPAASRATTNDYPAGTYFSEIDLSYPGGWRLSGNQVSLRRLRSGVSFYTVNEIALDLAGHADQILETPVFAITGSAVISGSVIGTGSIYVTPQPLVRFTGSSPFEGRMEVNNGVLPPFGDVAIDGSLPHVTLYLWYGAVIGSGTVQFVRIAKGATLYRASERPDEPLSHLHTTAIDQQCVPGGCSQVEDVPVYFEVRDADHYATLTTTGLALFQNLWTQIVAAPAVPPGLQLTIVRSGGIAEIATPLNGVPRYVQWSGRFPWLVDQGANEHHDIVIKRLSWWGAFHGPQSTMTDVLWRNEVTGANAIWVLAGRDAPRTVAQVINLPSLPNTDYRVAGTADFDGDGNSDILWWNRTTGAIALWLMNGPELRSIVDLPGIPDTAIQPVAVGDFNTDGMPEIVFHNLRTGAVAYWIMNGASFGRILDASYRVDPSQFRICGAFNTGGGTGVVVQSGDHVGFFWTFRFNQAPQVYDITTLTPGDEVGGVPMIFLDKFDLFTRNRSTGTVSLNKQPLPPVANPDWRIVGPR